MFPASTGELLPFMCYSDIIQIIEGVNYFKLRSKMSFLVFDCVHLSVLIENKFLSEVVLKKPFECVTK